MTKVHLSVFLIFFSTISFGREPSSNKHLISHGEYLANIAGCKHCHSSDDGAEFAGGRVIESPYGDFYSPNISSDPEYGIGKWKLDMFEKALKQGLNPEGDHYYPSFPYTSYQNLNTDDVKALFVYLKLTTPYAVPSKAHEVSFPYSARSLLSIWKWLYLDDGKATELTRYKERSRGQYLVYAITHCDQCHSPRTILGGVNAEDRLSGGEYRGNNTFAPPILKSLGGLTGWDVDDLETYLLLGEDPSGDYVGGDMVDVIDHMTNYLTNEDLRVLSEYLLSH